MKKNPCNDYISDYEYLQHMIPHHQVAIDMSNLLIPVTENPTMLHMCRDIIRKQSYEIWEMNLILKNSQSAIKRVSCTFIQLVNSSRFQCTS